MTAPFRVYPPRLTADVEVAEQLDGGRRTWLVGSAAVGRYIILRELERKVFDAVAEGTPPSRLRAVIAERHGTTVGAASLTNFLGKLDGIGLFEGVDDRNPSAANAADGYIRFNFFNPDPLFRRLLPYLRWIWTPTFLVLSATLIFLAGLSAAGDWAATSAYAEFILREHLVAVAVASWIVIGLHEFAHGMTCAAFGGRASELGALLVYYFLPALYCNVSGIHLIDRRSRRLWVIAAGVYWQLMVGAAAYGAWRLCAPHSWAADLAFIVMLGSLLDVAFNACPFIKLDGYYFLSQFLRMPNLMDRSRAYWGGLVGRLLTGAESAEMNRFTPRERWIFLFYGAVSTLFSVGLTLFLISRVGEWLMDDFYLPGVLATCGVAALFTRRPLGAAATWLFAAVRGLFKRGATTMPEEQKPEAAITAPSWVARHRSKLVKTAAATVVLMVLAFPWPASVGSYGTLIAEPGAEAIIRAPEGAMLVEFSVMPGERVNGGHVVGKLGNPDFEEQIAQVKADLAKARAEAERLAGDIDTGRETVLRAEVQVRRHEREYTDYAAERRNMKPSGEPRAAVHAPSRVFPPAIAALRAEVELRRARRSEAEKSAERLRALYSQGIVPRGELDAAETGATAAAQECASAEQRFEAALVDHDRKFRSVESDVAAAKYDASTERSRVRAFGGELGAVRALVSSLEGRLALLEGKRARFTLVTPRAGTVFGEETPRRIGQFFEKGSEVCRVADTRRLLVRIQVGEREIGDIRAGQPVRLKTVAFPDRIFRGTVTKIGGEGERDKYDQPTYRVELLIDNASGDLRPGMSAFARIDFGRSPVGFILMHKLKQILRPELWML